MIPRIIHQTARGRLSWEERRLTTRLRRMLPGWRYKLWSDADNARLMRERFPAYADRFDKMPRGVMRADVARYAYLHADGGWYFDTDYKLLRPIGPELMTAACVIPLEYAPDDVRPEGGRADGPGLGNAVLGSRAGHPFWADFIAHIFDERLADPELDEHGVVAATGPHALTRFYLSDPSRYPDVVTPARNLFFPSMSLMAMRTTADADTYGVHLCWGSWRGRPLHVAARTLARRKLNAL